MSINLIPHIVCDTCKKIAYIKDGQTGISGREGEDILLEAGWKVDKGCDDCYGRGCPKCYVDTCPECLQT